MAKYADYTVDTTIEDEINEATEQTANREVQIPSQFDNKSREEIAQSYQELKSMSDRQANELGELRKTTSTLTDQLLNSSPEPEPTTAPVTVDDLYDNPQAVIDRAVDARVSGKLEELERTIKAQAATAKFQELEGKYPTLREDAKSPEMQNWLAESGYRQRLAQAADGGDLQAAEDLFGMYYDLKGTPKDRDQTIRRESQLKAAGLESGTTDTFSPVEKFSRSKLELARRNAKRGDDEAAQYLKENSDAIFSAYAEGRLVN